MQEPVVISSYLQKSYNIDPFFLEDKLDYDNTNYFPNKYSRFWHTSTMPVATDRNIHMEMRLYIQNLVSECKSPCTTVHSYIYGLNFIAKFYSECLPNCHSICDISYNEGYILIRKHMEKYGINTEPLLHKSKTRVCAKTKEWITIKTPVTTLTVYLRIYKFIKKLTVKNIKNERERDVWEIDKLGIPYKKTEYRKIRILNFSKIHQLWLRNTIKDYSFHRIQKKSSHTVAVDIICFNLFSDFLFLLHPEICSLSELNRTIIEEYLEFLSEKGYSNSHYDANVSSINTLITNLRLMGYRNVPLSKLFYRGDWRKKEWKEPSFYTENEIRQINEHISDLPAQLQRMVLFLEDAGLRLADICVAKIIIDGKSCLVKTGNNDYIFSYLQLKTCKINTIPIDELDAMLIKAAIKESQDKFGERARFIFQYGENEPYSTCNIRNYLNAMALRNHLMSDAGDPLWILAHEFRKTCATTWINNGIPPEVVIQLLGQSSLGVLKHYVVVHGKTMNEYLKPMIEEDDKLIRNIGKKMVVQSNESLETEAHAIPLVNGWCEHACDDIMACLDCVMCHPTKESRPYLIDQYKKIKEKEKIARLQGFERLAEINYNLCEKITKFIGNIEDNGNEKK